MHVDDDGESQHLKSKTMSKKTTNQKNYEKNNIKETKNSIKNLTLAIRTANIWWFYTWFNNTNLDLINKNLLDLECRYG